MRTGSTGRELKTAMTFTELLRIINRLPDEALQPVADLALQLIQKHEGKVLANGPKES